MLAQPKMRHTQALLQYAPGFFARRCSPCNRSSNIALRACVQYTEGECNPLAGDDASVKYTCNATSVTVLEYSAYGCVGPATTTVYPTGECVEAVRAFNTIYTCNRTTGV
jgi:hypothetical protein